MRRAVALAIALGLAAPGCGGATASGPPLAMTVSALDGGDLDLGSYRGKVVVLHLFATWDLGAQVDVPELNGVAGRKDVAVIGIALDPEGYPLVAPWRKASEVQYQIALADDAIRNGTSALGAIEVVPTTIVLDRRGRVHARLPRALHKGELAALVADAATAD